MKTQLSAPLHLFAHLSCICSVITSPPQQEKRCDIASTVAPRMHFTHAQMCSHEIDGFY